VPGSLLSDNFNVKYRLGILTVTPAQATVKFVEEDLSKIYSGVGMQPTVITEPEGLQVDFTFNGNSTLPANAGNYQVVATVNDMNYVGENTATFNIQQAPASVRADDKVIKTGDPLPTFTATFTGLVNNEKPNVVTSLTFTLNPDYSGLPGTYAIIPFASAVNYSFSAYNGLLYVNPYGPGTKNVKVSLVCIEPIPTDADGYSFIANFRYENPNAHPVYVGIGPENRITGTGKFENSNQPVLFLPGTGTWQARFDGSRITWSLTTYNGIHKSSTASNASSTSNRCNTKSATIVSQNTSSTLLHDEALKAYPNPTNDKVYLSLGDREILQKDVFISDVAGRILQLNINKPSRDVIEVDFSGLQNGLYFIRLNIENEQKTVRIIKQ
jgi:hypothetical protein